MINSFIIKRQPKSYNSWKKNSSKGQNYIEEIRNSFTIYNPTFTKKTEQLYGIAYYFHSKKTGTDADNISKPIWDGLTDFLFVDDKQVKLRIAGCFDLNQNDFDVLDVSGVSGNVVAELMDSINTEEHIIYVECGSLNDKLFKFNLE